VAGGAGTLDNRHSLEGSQDNNEESLCSVLQNCCYMTHFAWNPVFVESHYMLNEKCVLRSYL
jgi:hypothetical protein